MGTCRNRHTNLNEPYKYIACDPLGENPPVGGEVNTVPTTTWGKAS